MAMDVVDYRIEGGEMQYVEIELDPGEAMVGEAGSLMYLEAGIALDAVFGDGGRRAGLLGKLVGAGKRLLTGESMFTSVYVNEADVRRRLAFASPYPGRILPMDLGRLGGRLICQRDAFLCAARGVSLGIAFQKRLGVGFFGGEGLFFATLRGPGRVWLQSLPFSRLASRVFAAAPQGAGVGAREQGGLTGVFGGDRE